MRLALVPFTLIPLVAGALFLASCGDDDDAVEPRPTTTVAQDTAPAPTAQLQPQPDAPQELDADVSTPEGGVISIEARGQAFAPNRWTASLGEAVIIRVTNSDEVQHNLRIAGLDGAFDTEDDALTVPDAIGAGEAAEVNFAPLVPGNYTFRCDFHPDTMGGQIEVDSALP
jgi:plastocyanin